jgi:hypothetical protein
MMVVLVIKLVSSWYDFTTPCLPYCRSLTSRSKGIHNIFVVIPQFLVTGLSSILFALLESDKSVLDQGHAGHPAAGNVPPANVTDAATAVTSEVTKLLRREAEIGRAGSDSVGIIFRYVHNTVDM